MSNVMGYGNVPLNPLASSSGTHYGQQFPIGAVDSVISGSVPNAVTPVALHVVDRADSVFIVKHRANMKFFFGTSRTGTFTTDQGINFGSLGHNAGEGVGNASASMHIPIQPTGWTSDSAATGDVVFYYKGKRR